VLSDLRQAARSLRRTPITSLGALATSSLGLAATIAAYGLIDAVLLHPVDVREPRRVVRFFNQVAGSREPMAGHLHSHWRRADQGLHRVEGVAAYGRVGLPVVFLDRGDHEEAFEALAVSSNYFAVIGARMARGAGLQTEHDRPGSAPVVVIGYDAWQRAFQGSEDVVGRTVRINDVPVTVVGVAERGSHRPDVGPAVAFFFSMRSVPPLLPFPMSVFDSEPLPGLGPTAHWHLVARLRAGVSIEEAEAEADLLDRHFQAELAAKRGVPPDRTRKQVMLMPVAAAALPLTTRGEVTRFLGLLALTVSLLLVLGCASVVSLFLARLTERRKEMAVRISLGAGQASLTRIALAEAFLVAAVGGAVGLALSRLLLASIAAFWMPGLLPVEALAARPPLRVAVFAAASAFLAAALCALGPAWQAARTDVAAMLVSRPGATGRGRSWAREAVVAAQVAIALTLLVGAALFQGSLSRVIARDLGFASDNILVGRVPTSRHDRPEDVEARLAQAMATLRSHPVIEDAAVGPSPLEGGTGSPSIRVAGVERRLADGQIFRVDRVGPRYFGTLGVALLAGREIGDGDLQGDNHVAVVNEAFARAFWPGESVMGRRFTFLPLREELTIVGVAKDARWLGVQHVAAPSVYLPRTLTLFGAPDSALVARLKPGTVARSAAAALRNSFPAASAPSFQTIRDSMASRLRPQRLALTLFGWFALVAALVGTVGVSALVAAGIAERSREIAVRSVLGAEPGRIHALMARRGLGPVLAGCAIGLVLAYGAAGGLRAFLLDIDPFDAPSFARATFALLAGTMAAAALVARRATRVDPMTILRAE
jgi:predicted permease